MNTNLQNSLRIHIAEAIRLTPLGSEAAPIATLLTETLTLVWSNKPDEAKQRLLAAKREAQRRDLWYVDGKTLVGSLLEKTAHVRASYAQAIDDALKLLQQPTDDRLTLQDLEKIVCQIRGQIQLDGGVFVERGCGGWYVGSNGYSLSEPRALDENGVWDGEGNHYFPTPLAALEHAKRHGYLK